ncbi:hypothetical protein CsatA_024163 [Cannabis sativa]
MTENEWYFYYKKNSFSTIKNNKRLNRKAKNGTWHGNATKKSILNQQKVEIGFKRTLDFTELDKKLTLWKMTEYHLLESNDTQQCTWILCKIYKMKSKEKKTFTNNKNEELNTKRQKLVQENIMVVKEQESTEVFMNDEKNIAIEQKPPNNASTELMKNELESITANLDNLLADPNLLADLDEIFQN